MGSRNWSRRDLLRAGVTTAAMAGLAPLTEAVATPPAPGAVVFDALGEIRTVYDANLVDRILDSGTRAIAVTITDPKAAEADAFDLMLRDLAGYNLYLRSMPAHYVQAASVVIIAEPQWKPSTEAQAIARAHRMGQTRKVHVHRLLAKDSVDERMREIIEDKQRLFDEYARKSAAKEADARAVDSSLHRKVDVPRDEAMPAEQRIIAAERRRLGIGR